MQFLVWVGGQFCSRQDLTCPHPEIYPVEITLGVCQNLASRMCYHSLLKIRAKKEWKQFVIVGYLNYHRPLLLNTVLTIEVNALE